MKNLTAIALLVFATQASAAEKKADCNNEQNYPTISKTELKTVAESKKAFIVDVNSKESFETAHVPGAIHFGTQEKEFAKLLPADKSALIVAYCGSTQCTAWQKAAKEACKLGYTNVKHFKEGIKGWTATN